MGGGRQYLSRTEASGGLGACDPFDPPRSASAPGDNQFSTPNRWCVRQAQRADEIQSFQALAHQTNADSLRSTGHSR